MPRTLINQGRAEARRLERMQNITSSSWLGRRESRPVVGAANSRGKERRATEPGTPAGRPQHTRPRGSLPRRTPARVHLKAGLLASGSCDAPRLPASGSFARRDCARGETRPDLAVALSGGRPRLQRRDRNGFAPFSLFSPASDKPPEHLEAEAILSRPRRLSTAAGSNGQTTTNPTNRTNREERPRIARMSRMEGIVIRVHPRNPRLNILTAHFLKCSSANSRNTSQSGRLMLCLPSRRK